MEHSASFFRPAILRHVFTVKLRFSGFQITEIITFYQVGINTVIRGVMPENILGTNRLQCVLQIQYQLPQISRILGIIRIFGKQKCGLSAAAGAGSEEYAEDGPCGGCSQA